MTVSVQRLNREPMFEYLICIIEQDECQCFLFFFFFFIRASFVSQFVLILRPPGR